MSSVFGIMTVERNEITVDNKIILHCYDESYDRHAKVYSNHILPVGTKLYWETNLKTDTTVVKRL